MWYWTNIKNNVSKNLEEKVIVFFYKYGELLVHRIVKISVDMISCKGDNSFRLEDLKKLDTVKKN